MGWLKDMLKAVAVAVLAEAARTAANQVAEHYLYPPEEEEPERRSRRRKRRRR